MSAADWTPTTIDDVRRRRSEPIADERGAFSELWRASWTDALHPARFVQANLSRSRQNVLRGMHFHRRQADIWMLLEGRAAAATTDLRPLFDGSPERPASQLMELVPGDCLYIPPLVAHGFLALEDLSLLYLVSHEYDGSDEYGFAWDDTAAAVPWPSRAPILSHRDRDNPTLAELVAKLRQHPQQR